MTDPSGSGVTGAQLFARYAYPPNELGYCGPDDPAGLLGRSSPEADAEITRRARQFEGAWAYLELIAESTGIGDPLDPRVVEAYWLGNDLLPSVDGSWLAAQLRARLPSEASGQRGGEIPELDGTVRPHHAYHVFAVYPWVGLLGRNSDVARSVLDQCRIRTAVVTTVDGPRATVQAGRLGWDGTRLDIGPGESLAVRWSHEGRSLLEGIQVGDCVSVHWDWVCDVLSADQAAIVERLGRQQLAATNRLLGAAG